MVFDTRTRQLKIIWNLIQENSEDNYVFSSAEKRALNYPASSGFSKPDVTGEGPAWRNHGSQGMALNTHRHWTILLR